MDKSQTARRVAIILAAGKGTRMKSAQAKVMHEVAGRAMIDWSIALARESGCERIIVVCSPGQDVLQAHVDAELGPDSLALQTEQLGTGHAVLAAGPLLAGEQGETVVLYGDTPLIRSASIQRLFGKLTDGAAVGVLGFEAEIPGGYGRLVLDQAGGLSRIVEAKDASVEELEVTLCNSGVMAASAPVLFDLLQSVGNDNAKGEYYLTDIVSIARARGLGAAVVVCDESEVLGVNSRDQLAEANAAFQARRRSELMSEGVTMIAPETVFFSHDTEIGQDCVIEPNVVFGPGVRIEGGVRIRAFTHIEGAHVSGGAIIGPFARLRPGTEIGENCHVGNFVEVKNVTMGAGAKANHLAYLGDGSVGAGANIGAGTIFCNYDGFNKARTEVGAGAFVGSNSALVAPVRIGDGAYIGSGSVITKDVPDDALAVARGRQVEREGWAAAFRSARKKDKPDGQ